MIKPLLATACLILATLLALALWPTRTPPLQAPAELSSSHWRAQGQYLAVAGNCGGCHTAHGGQPFAGGLGLPTPIGTVYSTNITPSRQHGIGAYSLEDFNRALRHGIAADGHSLYPAMPYPSYAHLSDEDVIALYAYFMQGVAPVEQANRANDVPWPLSMRWPLAVWRKWFMTAD